MRWAAALLLLLVPQDPAETVRGLVEKLESDEVATREAATAELVKLGPAAVPALGADIAKAGHGLRPALVKIVRRIERDQKVARIGGGPTRVTISAKDQPAAEVFAELAKQAGVTVEGPSLPDGLRLTFEAKDLPLAAAIDELCKAHGALASRWNPLGVQLVPGAPRTIPTIDRGPFRFQVDRFEFNVDRAAKPPKVGAMLRAGVVGPKGLLPDEAWIDVDFARDDRVTDLGMTTGPGTSVFRTGNSFSFPLEPDGDRHFVALSWGPPTAPSAAATKVRKLKGIVRMNFFVDHRSLIALKDPTGAPTSQGTEGQSIFEVLSWTRRDAALKFSYRVTYEAQGASWKTGRFERATPIVLENKEGRRLTGLCHRERIVHKGDPATGRWEIEGDVEFTLP